MFLGSTPSSCHKDVQLHDSAVGALDRGGSTPPWVGADAKAEGGVEPPHSTALRAFSCTVVDPKARETCDITGRRVFRTAGCREAFCARGFWVFPSLLLTVALALAAGSFSAAKDSSGTLELTTTAFRPAGAIPVQFTCSGENISPFLTWNHPPSRTQSFVLIVDDPDAPMGTWVHWVVYNLPASAQHLPEHIPVGEMIAGGGKQGVNDFPTHGYGGPCPPPGKPHRYFFRLYAIDTILNLPPPVQRKDVDAAMKGHVLAHAELMGTFAR